MGQCSLQANAPGAYCHPTLSTIVRLRQCLALRQFDFGLHVTAFPPLNPAVNGNFVAMQINYEDSRVRVGHVVVGPIDNNVYFVTCKRTGDSLMIDAASSPDLLVEMCKRLRVRQVVQTHGHWDHIGAVEHVRAAGLPVAVGAGDMSALDGFDSVLSGGEQFVIGDVLVRTLGTPGHTPGSICYFIEDAPVLFTGDTLFPGGPGATHFPGGNFDEIIESLEALFDQFDDETVILPGHGASSTIGVEREQFPTWKQWG
jgi:glyoxylase-like metal-dependent hydrolase (beta-lactamase superfamily II)